MFIFPFEGYTGKGNIAFDLMNLVRYRAGTDKVFFVYQNATHERVVAMVSR